MASAVAEVLAPPVDGATGSFPATLRVTALLAALGVALLFLAYGVGNEADVLAVAATLALIPLLLLIASTYPTSREYLFSSGFWLAVTIVFYLVVKGAAMISDGDGAAIVRPMLATCLFLVGYLFVAPRGHRRETPAVRPPHEQIIAPGGIVIILLFFAFFELFGVALSLSSGAGNTVLEVANATQNAGAGYLYRIPTVASSLYLILLICTYRDRLYFSITAICTVVVLVSGIAGGSRLALVILVLTHMYLYNRYIRPVNILYLALLAPPLVFVVVLFGYVRNIGVGDATVLINGLGYLRDNLGLVVELFMARLDMLPQMANGFALHDAGIAPQLNGMSYLYTFVHAIPRTIWPDKPPLTAALLTSIFEPGPYSDGVLFYPSVVVEALYNLGWTSIVVAGMAVGGLARGYDRLLASNAMVPMTWALTFFTFPMGLFDEGFHSNYIANIIYMSVLFFGMVIVLRLGRALPSQ